MTVVRVAALLLGLLYATLAHASVQRTFVASTGLDTNTCSLTQPARSRRRSRRRTRAAK